MSYTFALAEGEAAGGIATVDRDPARFKCVNRDKSEHESGKIDCRIERRIWGWLSMDDCDVPPDRAAIERMWESVVSCTVTRVEARGWARPWVEERDEEVSDLMSRKALQHLHGFGLRRDRSGEMNVAESADGEYLHEADDIEASLVRWRDACVQYDRDPRSYISRVKSAALRSLLE